MGKCVSKHPSSLTLAAAVSERDLAAANRIWSKFAESSEYIALRDEHGNQLCEYRCVSTSTGGLKGDEGRTEQHQEEQQNEPLHHHGSLTVHGSSIPGHGSPIPVHGSSIPVHVALRKNECRAKKNKTEEESKDDVNDSDGAVVYGDHHHHRYCDGVGRVVAVVEGNANDWEATKAMATTATPTIWLDELVVVGVDGEVTGRARTREERANEEEMREGVREGTSERTIERSSPPALDSKLDSESMEKKAMAQWDNRTHNNNQTTSTNNKQTTSTNNNQTTSTNNNNNNAGHNVGNIVNRSQNNNNSYNTMTDLSQLWLLRGHQQQQQEQQQQHILNDDDDNNNNNNNNIDGDANNNEMVSSRNSKNKNEENKNSKTDSFSGKQRMINCKQRAKAEKSEKSNFKNKHYGKHILDTDDDNEIDLENNGRHRHRDDDHGTKLNDESNDHDDDDDDDDGLQRCFSFRSGTSRKEGQSESKKLKKHGVIGSGGAGGGAMETKGTAMSFGFRKKHNTTPKKSKKQKETTDGSNSSNKKKHDNKWDAETGGDGSQGAVIDTAANDKNGNTEQMLQQVHFEKVGAAVAAKSHHGQGVPSTIGELQQQQQQQQSNRPGAGNRFGFKGTSIVRPASTGFTSSTSRLQSDELYQVHANVENNNCGNGNNNNSSSNNNIGDTATGGTSGGGLPYKSNLKRRSKSAHSARSMTSNQCDPEFGDGDGADGADRQMAGTKITQPKTITFNLNHNTIEYQRRQFFQQTPPATSTASAIGGRAPYNVVNTGLHTNLIVRPTPRAAAATAAPFTKFTLQTTSLPKPEYPVPIRVGTTPTSAGPPTILHLSTGARAKEAAAAHAHTNAQSNAQMHSQAQGHSQSQGHSTAQGHANAPGHSHSHMDQKTAKQMANSTRRGFNGSREISADSGIASLDIALAGVDTSSSSASSGGGGSGRHASPKRSRSRPRNLQMVMSGRHKFEVRDLDDPLSSESSSVEPLALPKLPAENQTAPLPLSGLVRSNTVLSREAFLKSGTAGSRATSKTRDECDTIALSAQPAAITVMRAQVLKQPSEESDSVEEEKLHIDSSTSEKNAKHLQKFRDINMYSSKTSSGGSSLASATTSWCNAGESLAAKDCSSLSLSRSSSEDSNKLEAEEEKQRRRHSKDDDDLSTMLTTDMQISSISSMTESLPAALVLPEAEPRTRPKELPPVKTEFLASSSGGGAPADNNNGRHERPQSLCGSSMDESKFAEMAAAGSEFLLDDETSPTDSLVSSTDSDDAGGVGKQQKRRANEEIQEKDLDEISPELEEVGSPISPGTPTHASHSLSLSDCGNLIDDEIADQPALLFNNESGGDGGGVDSIGTASASHKGAGRSAETPTLMETGSMRSLKSQSKARTALQQAIELSLRTPISVRKAVMRRAESLDTLSPCESICSDDLMMDFDMTSSMDSIDKSMSIKSRSGSDLNKLDETMLFSDLERKGSDVMKELNTILRVHTRNPDKESVIAQLPARATRLLNRSRLQQQCQLSNADSESPKSNHSQRRSNASRGSSSSQHHHHQYHHHSGRDGSSSSQHHHHQYHHHSGRDTNSSSDDLMLYDKSFRNAMIQDVLQFKKQLLRLRRILQEDEDLLMRTETLNPFETDNGQIFASCGLDSKLLDDIDLASLTSSTTDDPLQELADLRRQVVYLQGQVDDRDRTIRLQRNLIEKLEAEKGKPLVVRPEGEKECINMATQTERTRPISIGPDGLSRSKPEYTSYTTYFPVLSSDGTTIIHQQQQQQHPQSATSANQTRRHTIISTTFTNYNHQPMLAQAPRRASIAWESQTTPPPTAAVAAATTATAPAAAAPTTATYKPVKITLIGEPMKQEPPRSNGEAAKHNNNNNHSHNNSPSTNGCNGSHQHVAATAAVDGDKRRNGTSGELSVERNGLHRNGHHSHPAEVTNTTTNGTQQHGFYQQQHQQLQQQQQQLYDKYQQHKLSYNNMKHIGNSNNTTTTTTKNRCGSQQPVVTIV